MTNLGNTREATAELRSGDWQVLLAEISDAPSVRMSALRNIASPPSSPGRVLPSPDTLREVVGEMF